MFFFLIHCFEGDESVTALKDKTFSVCAYYEYPRAALCFRSVNPKSVLSPMFSLGYDFYYLGTTYNFISI